MCSSNTVEKYEKFNYFFNFNIKLSNSNLKEIFKQRQNNKNSNLSEEKKEKFKKILQQIGNEQIIDYLIRNQNNKLMHRSKL